MVLKKATPFYALAVASWVSVFVGSPAVAQPNEALSAAQAVGPMKSIVPNKTYTVDGPDVHESLFGLPDSVTSQKAFMTEMSGPHTKNKAAIDIVTIAPGAGHGASYSGNGEFGLSVRTIKKDWANSTVPGSVGGEFLFTRSGGPTSGESSGGYAFNYDVGCISLTGFCAGYEGVTRLFNPSNTDEIYDMDIQSGILDDRHKSFIGASYTSNKGVMQTALRFIGTSPSSRWTRIISNDYDHKNNFFVTDEGHIVLQSDGTTKTRIELGDEAGTLTVRNGAGRVIAQLDQNGNLSVAGAVRGSSAAGH